MKYCPVCSKEFDGRDVCPDDGSVLIRQEEKKDALLGQVLKGTFRIDKRIAEGGMGAVYLGTQLPIGRAVAIKVLLPELQSDPNLVKRFFREAKVIGDLTHPNIVRLIDCGNTSTGLIYLVTEYLQGRTLQQRVESGLSLTWPETKYLVSQICAGVGEAHRHQLIHRDLKPANIMLLKSQPQKPVGVKVLDFGIAKSVNNDDTQLTSMGLVLGTPAYISPEQISHEKPVSFRSDIYSLGGLLYYMVCGKAPYSGNTPQSVISKQLTKPPEPIDFDSIDAPQSVRMVIEKAMALQPEQRFETADELLEAVEACGLVTEPVPKTNSAQTRSTLPDSGSHPRSPTPRPININTGERASLAATMIASETSTRSGRSWMWLVALVLVVIASLMGYFLYQNLVPQATQESVSARAPRVAVQAPAAEPNPTGVTQSEVTIGMTGAFSGPARELGRSMKLGIESYFSQVNKRGGIHGRKLRLVALDDGYEPDRARKNMGELLHDRRVFAILGCVGTPTARVTAPMAVQEKVLFFGAFTGTDSLRNDPPERYVFNYRASYGDETAAIVKYFVEQRKIKPSQIAVFAQNDSFGDSGFQGVVHALRGYGVDEKRIVRVGYERNSTDIGQALSVLSKRVRKIRAVVLVATYLPAAKLIREMRKRHYRGLFANVSFVGAKALAETFRDWGDDVGKDVIVTQVVPHFASGSTGVRAYRQSLQNAFPNESPSFVSLEGYIAASILGHALEKVGRQFDTESLIDQLESIRSLDLGFGVRMQLGPSDHQASNKVWATQLTANGSFDTLSLD